MIRASTFSHMYTRGDIVRSRLDYVLATVVLSLFHACLMLPCVASYPSSYLSSSTEEFYACLVIFSPFILISIYGLVVVSCQRFRDIGANPYLGVLSIIPALTLFIFIYCALMPGHAKTEKARKFTDKSLPLYKHILNPLKSRRNRKSLTYVILLIFFIQASLTSAIYAIISLFDFGSNAVMGNVLSYAYIIQSMVCWYILLTAVAQRMRDLNITSLILLPLVAVSLAGFGAQSMEEEIYQNLAVWFSSVPIWMMTLALLVVPGTKGDNRYGEDPTGRGSPDDRV